MFARMLAFLGACGLIIVLTGVIPVLPAYATGTNCTGTCKTEDDGSGGCHTSQPTGPGACANTGTGCGCHTSGDPPDCDCT